MTLLTNIGMFIVGLLAIVKGADWLTDGAAEIAERFGIPSLVVGLTIVAVGSSAPEFVVSVVSALHGNADMALGNIVGSNIFNILAILGITALVAPIKVDRGNVRNDVPFVILSSIVIAITALDPLLDSDSNGVISRSEGLLMLCMFAIFMSYTFSIARNGKQEANIHDADAAIEKTKKKSLWHFGGVWGEVCAIVVGLTILVGGGEWMVEGASGIALEAGISESIVALTIVSIGTSAPELAASVMAARKGDTAMALGNIVGSVVFNVFFVLGVSASILPLGIGNISLWDIVILLAASLLLYLLCRLGKPHLTLTRSDGAIMVALIVAYYAWLVSKAI